ncbi:MAG: TIM barrel protein [Clostridiaceae bacterium]|nr:TIM barrel protein [Clostridiaceae bacterium]
MPRFGVAGNPADFYDKGWKHSVQMPGYLASMGLDAYEYQCGRGVAIGQATAAELGAQAVKHGVRLSVHAPYYINLAGRDAEKLEKSYGYILDSMEAATWMGGDRVVVHPGSANAPGGREEALALACKAMQVVMSMAEERGLADQVAICPELMGKVNQLGNLDEVITLCSLDDRLIPTIDFGHFNARTHGGLKVYEDFRAICDRIADALGQERMKRMHIHFSRIEYTAGGEKMHHTFADTQYGPEFNPLAQVMRDLDMDPVIICESKDTQSIDAAEMKRIYLEGGNRT